MVGPCSFDQTSTIQPLIAMMLNQSYWHYRLVSRQEKDTQIHPNPIFLSFSRFIAPILGGWPTRKVNNQLDLCKSLNSFQWMEWIHDKNILLNRFEEWFDSLNSFHCTKKWSWAFSFWVEGNRKRTRQFLNKAKKINLLFVKKKNCFRYRWLNVSIVNYCPNIEKVKLFAHTQNHSWASFNRKGW